jgi:hypothetical protein
MIKLKQLFDSHGTRLPDPSLGQYILENKVVSMTDWLYHGSPLEGLKSIIINGVWGTEHGEVAEYDTLSTSLNSEVLVLFSEGEGETGEKEEGKDREICALLSLYRFVPINAHSSTESILDSGTSGYAHRRSTSLVMASYMNVFLTRAA